MITTVARPVVRRRSVPLLTQLGRDAGATVSSAMFLAAHVPIGLAVHRDPNVAAAHALLTAFIGAVWATHGDRRPDRVAYVVAYVVGAEVLWRMSGAPVAWEFAKYVVIGVLGLWMLQRGRLQGPLMSTLYFALLLPSVVLTVLELDASLARQQITFNLSGPLALMVAVWFFSQVQLSPDQRKRLYVAAIAPVLSIAAITFIATLMNPDIKFGSESSMEASGGFGPNQVSAQLGLGALLALLGILDDNHGWGFKPLMVVCILTLSIQSALTFSRGGLINATAAALLASVFLLRDAHTRHRVVVAGAILAVLGYYVVFPALDNFTDGALSSRFSDTGVTNRDTIVQADISIWRDHLVMGVGPGMGNYHREAYIRNTPAHTEYSRMLAEHGLFGLASLIALATLVLQTMRQQRPFREGAVMIALFAWSFLFMLSYGMRLAAPSLMFGLACCLPTGAALLQTGRRRPLRQGVILHQH